MEKLLFSLSPLSYVVAALFRHFKNKDSFPGIIFSSKEKTQAAD